MGRCVGVVFVGVVVVAACIVVVGVVGGLVGVVFLCWCLCLSC